jgi:hypothetical protein
LVSATAQLSLIRRFLTPDAVSLEIAAQDCRLTPEVAGQVRFAYGVTESSPTSTGELPTNVDVLTSSQSWIPIGDDRVTVAFSDGLVEDLDADKLTRHLHEVKRVLVPGGVYVCRLSRHPQFSHDSARDTGGWGGDFRACRELIERFDEAGYGRVRARVSIFGRTVPCPAWVPSVLESLLGFLPQRLRRTVLRVVAIRSLLETVTLVAWKDDLVWRCADQSAPLSLGVA